MFRWVGGLSLPVAVGAFAALACSPAPESETITFGRSGAPGGQWPVHGGDTGHTQYAALDQINADNVADLEIVWRWKSPDVQLRETHEELQSGGIFRHEATPLMVDGVLYVSTSLGQVVALDPWTGETIWSYDPELWRAGSPTNLGFLTRGVAHWTDGNDAKIFYAGGANATLVSIDAKTGAPDPQFGDGGKVDLTARLGPHVSSSNYTVTSPPVVTRGVVIVGSSIQDTPIRREAPPGDVRAFDVRTGELRWTFHTIPREGEFGVETWEDESWKTAGSVNVWTMMSVDEELGYVYLPLGTASHNWYGGHRPGDNLFATSLVCLDATTGERVWHFQFIHHPIWDWDLPAAPTLIDIEVDGEPIRAVAQVTKQGFLFVFDRVTGEPVWPIEERPVPQSDLPGETASPTQPFPTKPAPFERQGFTEDELIDFTPELRAEALEILADVDGGPLYAPPSTRGTLVNRSFRQRHLAFDQREYVVLPRIEIGVLIDTIQHVGDELLEKQSRGNADPAAQLASHGRGQRSDIGIVDEAVDPLRHLTLLAINFPDLGPDVAKLVEVESWKPNLDRARVVETGLGREIHVQPLRKRRQPLDALRSLEESRCSGHNEIKAWKPTDVDFVHQLAKRVQSFVADIATHTLQGLNLVEDEDHARKARIAEDQKHAL